MPWCTGSRLCRSGSAKVAWPSPPYVVPIRLKSVSFSEIASSAPSQNAHPAGAKLPPNIRISPTYVIVRPCQFWLGKMPCSAMQKVMVRNGCRFECGWLPPALRSVAALSDVSVPAVP